MEKDEQFGAATRFYRATRKAMKDNTREVIEVALFIGALLVIAAFLTAFGGSLFNYFFGSTAQTSQPYSSTQTANIMAMGQADTINLDDLATLVASDPNPDQVKPKSNALEPSYAVVLYKAIPSVVGNTEQFDADEPYEFDLEKNQSHLIKAASKTFLVTLEGINIATSTGWNYTFGIVQQ